MQRLCIVCKEKIKKGDEVWYSLCSCRRKARFFVWGAYNADIRRR